MRFSFRTVVFAAALTLNAVSAFGATIDVVFYDSRFGTYDDQTGVFTQLSTLPIAHSAGVASMNGLVYLEDMGTELFTVDPVTGDYTLVGSTNLTTTSGAFAGSASGLFEIDYSSNLFSINPLTGQGTLVGALGIAANSGNYDTSLSADLNYLYYTAGQTGQADELYRVDSRTGIATDLGSTGVTGIAGSALVNGNLELFQYGQGTNYTYSAPVGSTGFTQGRQLPISIVDGGTVYTPALNTGADSESATPEPSTMWLLGGGGLLVLLSRLLVVYDKRRSRQR
ncbi:MAG TPA: PEP-CTERM sorting domain-containing protein [Bryobacteraceae bacterium]|nr:PEP-CTERM sorting domain-containing protein [Bryobacteraceae bacterium]